METHPAAELFHLLTGKEYEAFKADIAERGLIEPIWLCDGKILDGRNRYRACLDVGIDPQFREYTGDSPTAFAWSANGSRRHLNKAQLTAIGIKMIPALKEEAKKQQGRRTDLNIPRDIEESESKEAAAVAAKIVGVSPSLMYDGMRVQKHDPELFKKVESGEVSAFTAGRQIAKKKKKASTDSNAKKQPHSKRAADIKRLASEGHIAAQIADELGIGAPQVKKIAKQHKITLPDAAIGRVRKIDSRKIIEQTVLAIEGAGTGLDLVNMNDLTRTDCAEWTERITESLKPISKLRRKLSEISNGKA